MKKVFIDGNEGTTGLRIFSRLKSREDIELLIIDSKKRKDLKERKKLINKSDYTFLCLPDIASIEAVSLVENKNVVIIDTSTAHRTNPEWAYGFAELSKEHREKISSTKRISVPGCYATGFNAIMYPLINNNFIDKNYNIVCFAISGYTGAGKKGIEQYEDKNRDIELKSPRMYALTQKHKHLKEMKLISGLSNEPIFCPIIGNYPNGMVVTIPLYTNEMNKKYTPKDVCEMLKEHYAQSDIVKVRDLGYTKEMIASNKFANRDDMEIEVNGNNERILITARFDNLGKGASGAAIQCMNISMGIDEKIKLNLGD